MIGWLSGVVVMRAPDHIILNVNGVGYVIYASERTLASLPNGAPVSLFTDLLVREDNLQLFGFLTQEDKAWHKLLTSVQGVGAKAALAILGNLGSDGVMRAITLGDVNAIKSAPGVGPKLAGRILSELKEKAPMIAAQKGLTTGGGENHEAIAQSGGNPEREAQDPAIAPQERDVSFHLDALSALTNLGYQSSEASAAIAKLPDAESTEELITAALRLLSTQDREA